MGGGGGGATQQMPSLDTSAIANNQTRANLNAATGTQGLNMINQVTPYGNLNYNQSGGYMDGQGNFIPQYTATSSLSPQQQGLLDQSNTQKSNLFNLAQGYIPALQQGLSTNLPRFGDLPNTQAYTDQAYKALTARGMGDITTGENQQRALNANQGVATGSEAYNRSFQPYERSRVDLSNQATGAAQGLADQYFNREVSRRNQLTQEATQQNQLPLQNFLSLTNAANGGQPTNPNFINTPQTQIQAPDVTSAPMAYYNSMMNNYTQGQAAQAKAGASGMGSLFGLAGSALGGVLGGPIGAGLGSSLFGMAGNSIFDSAKSAYGR